jgi:CRISPR-associated protein Cmr2
MPELQELSGCVRASSPEAAAQQAAFWTELRARLGELELRKKERLCAIALIKRRYARARDALGAELDVTGWPSTVDVAAVLWARDALRVAPKQAAELADAVVAQTPPDVLTGGVSGLLPDAGGGNFLRLGASWFHRSFVDNPTLSPLRDDSCRRELLERLRALTEAPAEHGPLGGPPIYYALLLADGDRLGELARTRDGSGLVSRSLARFTREVPELVAAQLGVTIYAGGDDVLALLPVRHALECAQALEAAYRRAFQPLHATLSAAVMFAHARSPLNRVLVEAHRMLDDVAKRQNGRSSLAAVVFRGGGPAVQWVTTWDRALLDGTRRPAAICIGDVVRAMALDRAGLSSGLLHGLRAMLGQLGGGASTEPGSFAELPRDLELEPLVYAELQHRMIHATGESDREALAHLTAIVSHLLRRSRNDEAAVPARDPRMPSAGAAQTHVGIDGLVLASFLANGGREDEHRS